MSQLKASLLRSPRISLAVCLLVSSALAQAPAKQSALSSLDQLSGAIQNLVSRVSPSVVRIRVTRYGTAEEGGGRTDLVVSQEEAVG
jgi:hypothetical protein